MITRIREVRRAAGLTLQDVADRCEPPTTAQTIGRLETGTRTVSVGWLNRIAAALDVTAGDLVHLAEAAELPVAALIGAAGAVAPRSPRAAVPPRPGPGMVAILVESAIADYRAGDVLWCDRIAPDAFAGALNRDVLLPRPAGRFLFGRLIGREEGRLQLLPPDLGARQQILADPPWLAVTRILVRRL